MERVRDPCPAETALDQWIVMLALGGGPLLALPENLLLLALMKLAPTTVETAELLAYSETLSSAMVAPGADALAPVPLLANTVVSTFRTAPPAVAAAPPPLPKISELLTVPTLGAASSTPLAPTREIVI